MWQSVNLTTLKLNWLQSYGPEVAKNCHLQLTYGISILVVLTLEKKPCYMFVKV